MQKNLLNYILFFFLSSLVLAGWYWIAAPTPQKKDDLKAKQISKAKDDGDKKQDEKKKDEKKIEEDKKKKDEKKIEEDKKLPVKVVAKKKEPAKIETLGGDGFHLTVFTTELGAAVSKVQLNRFKAANWRGEPVEPASPLELIQDNQLTPSYRLYHYEDPNDKNPVLGLGEEIWKFEGRDATDEKKAQEVRYSTTVPGREYIKITKTYRLEPKDYHVTLLLEFQDTREPNDKEKEYQFRYQLTGAQGLPIEGEWYASTFRNAFTGLVDPASKHLYRKMEDSARIAVHKGGDRFPEELAGNRLQYSGVANQYFAAMIVVDNEQPKREQGGKDWDKILTWARPTLESTEKAGNVLDIGEKMLVFRDDKGEVREYTLLPRVKQHLKDLDIKPKVNDRIVLSWYQMPQSEERVASWFRLGKSLKPQFDDITVRVKSEPFGLFPRAKVAHKFLLYHGPIKVALLSQFSGDKEVPAELVDRYIDTLYLNTLTDYPSDHFLARMASWIKLTDSTSSSSPASCTGCFSLAASHLLWLRPRHRRADRHGSRHDVSDQAVGRALFFSIKMQELAPEMKKIAEKYKDDLMAQQQARSELMKKHGVQHLEQLLAGDVANADLPGALLARCKRASIFGLPEFLWIKNLAAPDMLWFWGEDIPVISQPDPVINLLAFLYLGPYLNVLPIVAVVMMMIQQTQTMPPPTDEQQAMQQKMMKYMTIVFGIMFYKVAAGLCMYFIASALWGIAERKLLPKKKAPPTTTSAPPTTPIPPPPKWKGKTSKPDKADKSQPANGVAAKALAWWKEVLKQAEKK